MSSTEMLILKAASHAFATDPFPDDWEDMTDEQQNEWLSSHKWCHFDNDTNDEFYALIDTHADIIRNAIEGILSVVKAKLVKLDYQSEEPLDINQIDFKSLLD